MNLDSLSEEEVKAIKRAFSVFMMKIIKHSAIDYVRKLKARKYTEIAFNDAIEISVSLSKFDEDTFFDFNKENKVEFSNKNNERAYNSLSNKEKEIFSLFIKGYKIKEIARKMKLSPNNVKASICIARKKFKQKLEEE